MSDDAVFMICVALMICTYLIACAISDRRK